MSHCSVATLQNISVLVWTRRDAETLEDFTAKKMPTSLNARAATERKYRREKKCKDKPDKTCWSGELTFWSPGGDLSSLLSQTRREDRTSPWLSGGLPSNLHEPDPPDKHIEAIMLIMIPD